MSMQHLLKPSRLAATITAILLANLTATPIQFALAQTPAPQQEAADRRPAFTISSGPLAPALRNLASSANVLLTFQDAQTSGKTTAGINGRYTIAEAFTALLTGTGLQAVELPGGNYALREAPTAAGVLPAVKVSSTADNQFNAGYTVERERGYRSRLQTASGFTPKAILDTPFQVTVIPTEVIRDQQAKSLLEVTKNDPSVSEANSPLWYDRVNIRGFYLSVDAYYRDGLSANDQAQMPIENKAAVEINKGLSALRYGMTSPGGTVNYVVKRPTDTPTTILNIFGNNFGGRGAHLDAGGRYGEEQEFGVRVNVVTEDIRTHIEDVYGDRQFTSLLWDWQMTDKLLLELDYEHQQREITNYSGIGLGNFANIEDAKRVLPTLNSDTFMGATWARYPTEQTFYGARAFYQINELWRARVAVQQQYLNRSQAGIYPGIVDPATGNVDVSLYYSPDQDRNNFGVQLVLDGNFSTGFIGHELAFGYDYIERKMTYPDGYYEEFSTTNIYNPVKLLEPEYTSDRSTLQSEAEQQSLFVTDTLIFNEHWQLLLGLRHTKPESRDYSKSATNPTAGLTYKPRDTLSIYTSYAEGIEQGSVVPQSNSTGLPYANRGTMLEPLQSEQFELGIKAELFGNMLLSAAYFDINKGLEIERVQGAQRLILQDGSQRHRGVEITLAGEITESLKLIGGITHLDAEIKDTTDPALRGKRPLGVPETQANVFVDYELQNWLPGLALNIGIYHVGDKMVDDANLLAADAYTRWDVGARYQMDIAAKPITLRLNMENVTDKTYVSNATWGSWDIGAPRTIKLSAEVSL